MIYTNFDRGALLAGTDDGRIWSLKRNSSTWQPVAIWPGTGTVVTIAIEPKTGEYVYAGTLNGTVLVSTINGGNQWTSLGRLPDAFTISSIVVTSGKPKQVLVDAYGIGGNVVWRSDDVTAQEISQDDAN